MIICRYIQPSGQLFTCCFLFYSRKLWIATFHFRFVAMKVWLVGKKRRKRAAAKLSLVQVRFRWILKRMAFWLPKIIANFGRRKKLSNSWWWPVAIRGEFHANDFIYVNLFSVFSITVIHIFPSCCFIVSLLIFSLCFSFLCNKSDPYTSFFVVFQWLV